MKTFFVILAVLFSTLFSGVVNAQNDQLWSLPDSITILKQKDSILDLHVLVLKGEIAMKKNFLSETKSFKEAESLKKEIELLQDSVKKVTPHYNKELKVLKKSWQVDYLKTRLWQYNGFADKNWNCKENENKVLFLLETIEKDNSIDPQLKEEILYHLSFLIQRGSAFAYTWGDQLIENCIKDKSYIGLYSYLYVGIDGFAILVTTSMGSFLIAPIAYFIAGSCVVGLPSFLEKQKHIKELYELTGFNISMKDLPTYKEAVQEAHKRDFRSVKDLKKSLRNEEN